jgi:hypothetical protein
MIYIPRTAHLNCLLMLSSRQPPHPKKEMKWHYEHCKETGETWIATTRLLSRELQIGVSEIAFYGDSELDNEYLGKGIYAGYEEIGRPAAAEYLNSELYRGHHLPSTTKGFIGLEAVEIALPGETIEVLGGRMRESARGRRSGQEEHYRLVPENLPASAARIQVYYYKFSDLTD